MTRRLDHEPFGWRLHTGADLLTDRQKARLGAFFADDAHAEIEASRTMYQRTVAAYGEPDRRKGRTIVMPLITTLGRCPQSLARTHHARADIQQAGRPRLGLLRPTRHFQRTD